jgi:branched-chain amino acid transport system ATP-binding protein
MLAFARGLMSDPKVLLLDEPSLGLAPLIVKEIFALILRLKQEGITILLVEQNAQKALAIADYAYVLETGQIVAEGPGSTLLDNPVVEEAYLGIKRPAC